LTETLKENIFKLLEVNNSFYAINNSNFGLMKMPQNNLHAVTDYFKSQLTDFYDDTEVVAMKNIMLQHYFGLDRTSIALNPNQLFSESDLLKVINTVKRLKNKEPLAYILEEWEFHGLTYKVNKHTLIPRPETEELVALVLSENKHAKSIIDIGTGSGCIALSLKSELPDTTISAWDISQLALEKVKENAVLNQLEIIVECVDILTFKNNILPQKVEIIVSNPPYIPVQEKELMNTNVLDYEPHLALFIENNEPLLFYDAISDFAKNNLEIGGKLYFEINENYGEETKLLLLNNGFNNVEVIKDMNGKDRIVKAHI
jgi:release factor glutamine methyltransferase